jgi:hypothetical protein
MKKVLGALGVFFVIAIGNANVAFADGLDCRSNDIHMKILCADTEKLAKALNVDIRYLSALERARTVSEWVSISKPKSEWLSNWSVCKMWDAKNMDRAVKCVDDALSNSEKLFPFTNDFPEIEELRRRVTAKTKVMSATAREEVERCIVEKTMELDDGVSPAMDISMGVSSVCKSAFRNQVAVFSMSLGLTSVYDSNGRSYLDDLASEKRIANPADFVDFVLQLRAEKRAGQQAPKPAPQQKKQTKKQVES